LLLEFQNFLAGTIPFSGLLAIMSIGITIYQRYQILAERLSNKYNKIWVGAEILLFVLVGATVDLNYALAAGVMSLVIVAAGLLFRVMGVFFSLTGTKLSANELIFAMMAYTPKATVQAAIGGIPL